MSTGTHLDVSHVWQLDPDSNIPEAQRRRMCAPASVNMVLDFLLNQTSEHSFKLTEVADCMELSGGRVEEFGWKHSAQVATLKHYGLVAWRRNWLAPPPIDETYFVEHEGYDQQQVSAFLGQLQAEQRASTDPRGRAEFCIKQALTKGFPVIASVRAGFSENEIGHMVVISGYDDDRVDVVDPLLPADKQSVVTWDYFWEYFKLQAIFAKTPDLI